MTAGFAGRESELREAFRIAGQTQVFRFMEQLEAVRRAAFLDQLGSVDLDQLAGWIADLKSSRPVATLDLERLEPPRFVALSTTPGGKRKQNRANAAGEVLLRSGQAAAFVVAGSALLFAS